MSETVDNLKKKFEIPPDLEAAFNHITNERRFRRGDTITSISDLRNHFFYIVTGSARVYYMSQGKEHTYSFTFEDEYITMSFPLLNDENYVTTVEFLETTVVAVVPLAGLKSLLATHDFSTTGMLIEKMIRGMLQQMSALEERLLMMQTCTARERFEWLINKYPKILERAKMTQIASFLGITKETLYRIRAGKY